MSTPTEFPETHWEPLLDAVQSGGADAVIAYIDAVADPKERLKLYSFALSAFSNRPWEGKNMDTLVAVGSTGINAILAAAAGETDPDEVRRVTDFANMMSYNYSAALAECWPNDDVPRERRHFEEGLRAAENCIRWREEFNKPPSRRAIAFWAQGMHALSLGDLDKARSGFQHSFDNAVLGTEETKKKPDLSVEGDFNVILSTGYLGIAEAMAGIDGGRERYRDACTAFENQVANSTDQETREDAEFGLAQIGKVAGLYGVA